MERWTPFCSADCCSSASLFPFDQRSFNEKDELNWHWIVATKQLFNSSDISKLIGLFICWRSMENVLLMKRGRVVILFDKWEVCFSPLVDGSNKCLNHCRVDLSENWEKSMSGDVLWTFSSKMENDELPVVNQFDGDWSDIVSRRG